MICKLYVNGSNTQQCYLRIRDDKIEHVTYNDILRVAYANLKNDPCRENFARALISEIDRQWTRGIPFKFGCLIGPIALFDAHIDPDSPYMNRIMLAQYDSEINF